ncbi:MAG: ATP-binding protein [Desulfarculus sp.]|nr:ATP-binding protein [Desulfarculus sp.]
MGPEPNPGVCRYCGSPAPAIPLTRGRWLPTDECRACNEVRIAAWDAQNRRERVESLWAISGLPPEAKNVSTEILDAQRYRDRQGRAWDLVASWPPPSPDAWRAPWFFGPIGTGKTALAYCLARRVMEEFEQPVFFVGVAELLRRQRASFGNKAEDQDLLERAVGAGFLVLDDLGGQAMTPWVLDSLFGLIDARLKAQKTTLITSNYGPDALGKILEIKERPELSQTANALADRVLALTIPCRLQGESIRLEQAIERAKAC